MTYKCADCGETHEDIDDGCDCGSFVLATINDDVQPDTEPLSTFADNSRDPPHIILGDGDSLDELYESGAWIAMDATHALDPQCIGN